MTDHARIKAAIDSETWLITDDGYRQIEAVAAGLGSPESLAQARELISDRHEALAKVTGLEDALSPGARLLHSDSVGIVPIIGPVVRYASLFSDVSGLASHAQIRTAIEEARDDPDVEQILLYVDTPGGVAMGAAETSALISNAAKPTVAYIAGWGTSLGYYFSAAADEVFATHDAHIGSIGTRIPRMAEEDDDLVSDNAPEKRDSDRSRLALINSLEAQFIAHVADRRGVSQAHVKDRFGRGGYMLAPAALDAGMIDGITTLKELLSDRATGRAYHQGSLPMAKPNEPGEATISPADYQAALSRAETAEAELEKANTALAASPDADALRAEGAQAATARVQAILTSEEAVGREAMAQTLAFPGEGEAVLSADQAIRILAASPQAQDTQSVTVSLEADDTLAKLIDRQTGDIGADVDKPEPSASESRAARIRAARGLN